MHGTFLWRNEEVNDEHAILTCPDTRCLFSMLLCMCWTMQQMQYEVFCIVTSFLFWYTFESFTGSQEGKSTRYGCAQTRGNHRVWPEWPQGSVWHAGWQAVLFWWWAHYSEYREMMMMMIDACRIFLKMGFLLLLLCYSWTLWHLLAWHRCTLLTRRYSTH